MEGVDIMVALDVSPSMLAEDIKLTGFVAQKEKLRI